MSEEIRNPSLVVPRSIMLSIILNGTMGFAMLIALLFCIGDVHAALTTSTGYPYMEIFYQATRSIAGSAVMASLITILGICGTVGVLASTSRMFWALARDHGLPGWRILQKVRALFLTLLPRSLCHLADTAVKLFLRCGSLVLKLTFNEFQKFRLIVARQFPYGQ
jgi:amino acid transporter